MRCVGRRDRAKVPAAKFEIRHNCGRCCRCSRRGRSFSGHAAFSTAEFRALRQGFSTRLPFLLGRSRWFVTGICSRPEFFLLDALPCCCRVECRLDRECRGGCVLRAPDTRIQSIGGAEPLSNRMTAINRFGPISARRAGVTAVAGGAARMGQRESGQNRPEKTSMAIGH